MESNEKLFELISKEETVEAVTKAFDNLNMATLGDLKLSKMNISKQVVCGLFHELIVHEIAKLPGWYAGEQKVEADLAHKSGLQLQVKTSTSAKNIAGNRYASGNLYSDPSEYYLCVNYIPFECITKIRSGFVQSDSWNPQNGSGNAAFLSKDTLNKLSFLGGEYLLNLPLNCIEGIGEKAYSNLKDNSLERLEDIKTIEDFHNAVKIVRKPKFEEQLAQYLRMAGTNLGNCASLIA